MNIQEKVSKSQCEWLLHLNNHIEKEDAKIAAHPKEEQKHLQCLMGSLKTSPGS